MDCHLVEEGIQQVVVSTAVSARNVVVVHTFIKGKVSLRYKVCRGCCVQVIDCGTNLITFVFFLIPQYPIFRVKGPSNLFESVQRHLALGINFSHESLCTWYFYLFPRRQLDNHILVTEVGWIASTIHWLKRRTQQKTKEAVHLVYRNISPN